MMGEMAGYRRVREREESPEKKKGVGKEIVIRREANREEEARQRHTQPIVSLYRQTGRDQSRFEITCMKVGDENVMLYTC